MKPVAFLAILSAIAGLLPSQPARADDTPLVKAESVSGSGGTMHFAEELRFSAGDAAPLILKSSVSGGKLAPIPGPQYRIDDTHALVLGWSSYGGGMQTLHGLLIEVEGGRVTLRRELMLTAGRMAVSLLVRRLPAGELRLGISELPARPHNESDWSLVFGPAAEEPLKMAQIRKLPFVSDARRDDDVIYAPPLQNARFPPRVAWFSVSPRGFVPQP